MRFARAVLALVLTLGTFYTGFSLPASTKPHGPVIIYAAETTALRWHHSEFQEASRSAPKRTALAHRTLYVQTAPLSFSQGLRALIECESGGNYQINTGNGFYGAGQWVWSTWDAVWRRAGRPDIAVIRPDLASPQIQDRATFLLWRERGRQPWPICGRFLP